LLCELGVEDVEISVWLVLVGWLVVSDENIRCQVRRRLEALSREDLVYLADPVPTTIRQLPLKSHDTLTNQVTNAVTRLIAAVIVASVEGVDVRVTHNETLKLVTTDKLIVSVEPHEVVAMNPF
jgi:hypothetical protein